MLFQGQKIGQHLRGVRLVGQAVPHGHARVFCQRLDRGLRKAAVLDAVEHAPEHARRVGHALLIAHLTAGGVKIHGVHAKVGRRHLKGAARAGAGLFKQQRHVFARAQRVRHALLFFFFQFGRKIEQRADLGGDKIEQFEK